MQKTSISAEVILLQVTLQAISPRLTLWVIISSLSFIRGRVDNKIVALHRGTVIFLGTFIVLLLADSLL